jgi:hypothetical protein
LPIHVITNGDHAAEALRATFPDRAVLPWRDSLVDGPVPDLPDDEFDNRRATYLAAAFGYPAAAVKADFAARNVAFGDAIDGTSIALWFETDLYDQLQLLDILARLARAPAPPPLTLVQAPPPLPQHDLRALEQRAEPIADDDLSAAAALWSAVRQPTPEAMARAAATKGALPIARSALRRLLQELPAPHEGLSRIEREILRAVGRGEATPLSAFRVYMGSEELPFLGDAGFYVRLITLAKTFEMIDGVPASPVFDATARQYDRAFLQTPLRLTARGRDCLAGRYDLASHPRLDRWVGGTHLTRQSAWRWDAADNRLAPPS